MNAQLKKGVLDMCVLSQLKVRDQYGYELTEKISRSMSIATGTLYPILKRLKDEKLVETYLKESSDGPARKYYHLTDKGYDAEKAARKQWHEFVRQVEKILEENDDE